MNDESKLERILNLLPEAFVEDFVNYHLYNGFYPWDYVTTLDGFNAVKNEVMLEFHDEKANKKFQNLKEEFNRLNEFLLTHFSIPHVHYQMHEDPPFLYIEPRIHHNFRLSEGGYHEDVASDSREWNRLRGELNGLAENFFNAYRTFLRVASLRISKKGSAWSKFWFWIFDHIAQLVFGLLLAGLVFWIGWN